MLLDAALSQVDGARRAALGWALSVRWLQSIVVDKDRRVAVHAALLVLLSALVAVLAPVVPLVASPLLLGVPHLASEVRWLVVRARVPVALQLGLATAALALAGFAASGHVRAECALGLACVAFALGRSGVRRWMAAVPTAAAMACVASAPFAHAVCDVVIASHGFVTLAVWILIFRRSRRFALPALATLAVGLVAVGALRGPLVAMAFLASVHYAVWLVVVPSDGSRGAGTPTFRMSVVGWKRDLGVPVIAVATSLLLLVAIAALVRGAEPARDIYLVTARFHLWLELAMACFLVARKKEEE